MQKVYSSLEEIKLVGIKIRTCNKDELESKTPKIMGCVQRYFQHQLSNRIANRANPLVTYCAYTEYESDYSGEYTFFIGEEVSLIDNFHIFVLCRLLNSFHLALYHQVYQ